MKGSWCSVLSGNRTAVAPLGCSIAVDDELLSAITSEEAAAVTPQMSCIFLSLIAMIPDDPENSLPVAQEWLFRFDADGEGESCLSPWRQLQEVVTEVNEQELRRALDWMSGRHIISLSHEGQILYLAIRNVMCVDADGSYAEAATDN